MFFNEYRPLNDHYIDIKNIHFSRDTRVIFNGISLQIPKGKITAIMGPSGCGKTTLLSLIGAQLKPSSGQILVDGINLHALSQKKLVDARKNMGLLFQEGGLFTDLTVFENVAFPLREHLRLPEEKLREKVLSKLKSVGLEEAVSLMPSELSGGMARRVALARALVFEPDLMMYDEPFAGQDPITMGVLVKLIKEINASLGLTTILVSHDVAETASIADYIYLVGQGKVFGEGTPKALYKSEEPKVKQFMHGLAEGPIPFHYSIKGALL